MKKIQRFLRGTALLAVLSLLVSATAFAASVPDPTSDFYVNDYVGVLSGDTKSDIVSKNDGLYNATGAQIVVTVVQDTGGVSMEQYAYDMANAWGIGSAEKNNGVLLLLSVGDDDYQCIQGSGLETLLPTSTLSRILQEDLEPDFADKNYDAGVKKTFASLYDAVSSIYGYDGSTGGAANPSPVPQPDYDYGYGYGYDDGYRDDGGFSIFGMIVFLVIVLALTMVYRLQVVIPGKNCLATPLTPIYPLFTLRAMPLTPTYSPLTLRAIPPTPIYFALAMRGHPRMENVRI